MKTHNKRANVENELLETERKYLNDLDTLDKVSCLWRLATMMMMMYLGDDDDDDGNLAIS